MWRGSFSPIAAQIFQEFRPWRRLILGLKGGQVFHGNLKDPPDHLAYSALAHGVLIDPDGTTVKEGRQRLVYKKVVWIATDDHDHPPTHQPISTMKSRRTTLYAHAKDNKGQATTLGAVLAMVTDGKLEKPVRAIRERFAAEIANGLTKKEAKKALATEKGGLPCCTFSGLFEKRKADHLEEHTGVIVADLDLLTDDKMAALLGCLKTDPHVVFYFISPTGTGIKVGVRVPDGLERDTHAGSAFWALRKYAGGAWGIDVATDEFDDSCKDVSRLCFLSHDENLYVNWEAKPLPLKWGRAGGLVVKAPGSGDDELEEVDPEKLEVRRGDHPGTLS